MNRRGFSLVELLVVMAIMGILLGLVTFGFVQYSKKSQIESQTKQLYGNLMEYRAKAFYEKKEWTFLLTNNGYGIYSSSVTGVSPVTNVVFKYSVTPNSTTIVFDPQGTTNAVAGKTVCVADVNEAAVDSVVIYKTRVQIGKKSSGTTCAEGNINAK